jgi:hypothetical protein
MKRTTLLSAATPLAVAAAAILAVGDLNPPAGAVAETGKRLAEIEPRIAVNATNTPGDATSLFRITQPGSYYLTGNVTGASGKNGILITTGNVTLDLNGFRLAGAVSSLDGIGCTGAGSLIVRNGTVLNWGGDGIDLLLGTNVLIEEIISTNNIGDGISCGVRGRIRDCTASNNSGDGITSSTNSVVTGCLSEVNGLDGIAVTTVGVVSDCTSRFNNGVGIRLAALGFSTIERCTVSESGLDNILGGKGMRIVNNVSAFAGRVGTGAAIRITNNDSYIAGNLCTQSDVGIDVGLSGNMIVGNFCSGNIVNWDIVANNVVGVIVDRSAPASAAILGNSAPGSTGTTDPNANFTF